jgi:uncharacterized protein (TIGR00251 family)
VISDEPDGAVIDVKVIPRAGRTELAGTRNEALLIRLAAPPVEGAANDELLAFLARLLDLPRRNIIVVAGKKSRRKKIKVIGATAARLREKIAVDEC